LNRRTATSTGSIIIAHIVTAMSSLRLTVGLFVLSIFLIFAGTLAQTEAGIWAVMEQYFRTVIAWIGIRPLTFGLIDTDIEFAYPGGYLLGAVLLVNLIAAHLTRFDLTWRKSGISLIHTGLIVLILSEFFTGLFAEEGQMTIFEGGTSNYVEDIREVELALVDKTDPQFDSVAAVPESRLKAGKTLDDPSLPLALRIDRYYPHSRLPRIQGPGAGLESLATAGDGLDYAAEPRPRVTGVDRNESVNFPSAYVTAIDPETGNAIDTFLTSVHLSANHRPQVIEHDGRTYHLFLRFKRSYRPFALHLIDFKHEKYLGTDVPRNFASHLRLIDPSRNEDREVMIRMNEPLRYAGETFYQAAFKSGDVGTVLQVVHNPGWLMPYVSCGLITLGLVVQFGLSLNRFAGRRPKA
jgi:hypothetical protein